MSSGRSRCGFRRRDEPRSRRPSLGTRDEYGSRIGSIVALPYSRVERAQQFVDAFTELHETDAAIGRPDHHQPAGRLERRVRYRQRPRRRGGTGPESFPSASPLVRRRGSSNRSPHRTRPHRSARARCSAPLKFPCGFRQRTAWALRRRRALKLRAKWKRLIAALAARSSRVSGSSLCRSIYRQTSLDSLRNRTG